MGFWSYYKRVIGQTISECAKHFVTSISAAVIAFGAAYLQVHHYSQPATPAWVLAVTTAELTLCVFFLYVLVYAVRAPWRLYNEASRSYAATLEEYRTAGAAEVDDLTKKYAAEMARLVRENAEMKDLLGDPKLQCNIDDCEIQEFVSADIIRRGTLFSEIRTMAGISGTDTVLTLTVTISNTHQTETNATCKLKIRGRSCQEHLGTQQIVTEKLDCIPLDLTAPFKYASPRSGVLQFRFPNKSQEQLAGGRLILIVTDGVGQVSTNERQL